MVRQSSSLLHQLSWIAVYVQTFYATYEALGSTGRSQCLFSLSVKRQFFSSVSSQVMARLTHPQSDWGFAYTTLSGARANPAVSQVSVQSKPCSEQSSPASCPWNLAISWHWCLPGMATELEKWAQCHANRWPGVLGSQEIVYVCQVRVLRAGFPWLSSLSSRFDKGTRHC